MKKILTLVAIATILLTTSCSRDVYVGEERTFTYVPTGLRASLLSVNMNVATVILSNGTTFNVRVISPSQSAGDGFILEAPIVPQGWIWDDYSNQYKPNGFDYNTRYGFTVNSATVYFVEVIVGIPYLFKKSVAWANVPNPAEWVNSFSNMVGSTRASMPVMGTVTKDQGYPDRYFFSR
jgi:hypothetical protein